jgi:hypothetical protein
MDINAILQDAKKKKNLLKRKNRKNLIEMIDLYMNSVQESLGKDRLDEALERALVLSNVLKSM